ncbi:hypothetical protein PVL29_023569 [Vitis rotundifolia]|uniref:Hydroxyproline-rich glycoprotein family protein n=1 Tax=Vitis rotundifolia TaxID=103349 RepID=A0AA38YPH5_VITRO|nr:hypothetical protein PVL29_023569 [Vitis rotundifolia]
MENEGVSLSRPVIGFPVGLALLLILLLCMSALMSFCFHWDKFRCLRHSTGDHTSNTQSRIPHSPPKSVPPHMKWKQNQSPSLPVLMPGDEAPKFIAIPCPRVIVKEEKPLAFPEPLY